MGGVGLVFGVPGDELVNPRVVCFMSHDSNLAMSSLLVPFCFINLALQAALSCECF